MIRCRTWHSSRLWTFDHSPMGASFHCRALIDSGIVSKFRHLAGESEVQAIVVDDKKEGSQNWPLWNSTANSSKVRGQAIDDDPLPPYCRSVFNPGSNIALAAQGTNLPPEPFVVTLSKALRKSKNTTSTAPGQSHSLIM